ncbi:MAG: M23 family metallopeptidase, partial [Dysgonamonadaceae bacterium]|nr:M23 family metallopeptidase [Dysgonamonadaceae bacterium]
MLDSHRFFKQISIVCGLLFSYAVQAQDIAPPLDIPLFLSGNFGELRNNHFHSGVDFKTQGTTGLPVRAVNDGFISRISVSPYGYGNALYINHPDGKTSVYGHLERFAPQIEALVRDSQYQRESFSINLLLSSKQLPVKKGDRIAWSGNSGSSGGPHLHFEFRDTQTEKAIDPLPWFKHRIKDTTAPEIRELMIFPQASRGGSANGSAQNQALKLIRNKSGEKSLAQPLTAWGPVGVGIKAYDRMNETSNIYGVNEIILKVDGEEIYHSIMDGFSFEDTRYLNTYIDWKEWTERNSFFMKSFTDPGNRLGVNRSWSNGIFLIDQEKTYHLEYILKDVYENATVFRFDISGKPAITAQDELQGVWFPFNRDNVFDDKGVNLQIPRRNLYANMDLQVQAIPWHTPFAPLYIIGDRIPLHGYCPLTLDIVNDSYPDKSKYGIVSYERDKSHWLGGNYENGKITVSIRELGKFSVDIDTIPPRILPLNEARWETSRRIAFKISDNFSGIQSWRGTLDEQFALFEYDAKANLLSCTFNPQRMKRGAQTLQVVVIDGAGNR